MIFLENISPRLFQKSTFSCLIKKITRFLIPNFIRKSWLGVLYFLSRHFPRLNTDFQIAINEDFRVNKCSNSVVKQKLFIFAKIQAISDNFDKKKIFVPLIFVNGLLWLTHYSNSLIYVEICRPIITKTFGWFYLA